MKSKKELNQIAQQIASIERKIQKVNGVDKNIQSYAHEIEVLLEGLSPKEIFELDGAVIEILKKY